MWKNKRNITKKIQLAFKLKKRALAAGAQTKNTLSFAEGNSIFLSPLHANLNNPKDFLSFEKDLNFYLKKRPQVIAHDLHPEYLSTKSAQLYASRKFKDSKRHSKLYAVQHHHAHIASCMAENGLKNTTVIGLAFDGTGLGADNNLWGAEFLICNYKSFLRAAHLKEIPLLGGEKAILEPWRVLAAWLYLIYQDRFLNLPLKIVAKIKRPNWQVLKSMHLNNFNTPLASSIGRLFDAVASLVLAKDKANFEAELAMRLEQLAMRCKSPASYYRFKIIKNKDTYIIDPALIFKEIISDLAAKEAQDKIALRFHLSVAEIARKTCVILRKRYNIAKVVLSGGVFQNKLLFKKTCQLLSKEKFTLITHKKLPCNDANVSLGQAVIASFGA